MAEKLLEDLGKLESEPRNWPPPDEQLFAWRYPTVPEEINRNSLLVAMGLEHLAHAQLLHAELRGEWTPSVMELDWPGSTPQDPEAPREALTFRRVGKLGSRWADVV